MMYFNQSVPLKIFLNILKQVDPIFLSITQSVAAAGTVSVMCW